MFIIKLYCNYNFTGYMY